MDGDERTFFLNMDPTTTAIFKAANIITDMLPSLSEEDLLDLFPGPEPFFRRRAIWRIAHVENEGEESDQVQPGTSSGLCDASTISSTTNPVSSPSSSSIINPSSNPRDQHGTSRTVQLESVKKQLLKRVQNVTPTKKKQGATPWRKRRRLGSSSSSQETFADDTESSVSTLILKRSPPESRSSPEATEMAEERETSDSRQNQARHHKVPQELYKSRPTPNKKDVAQLLDLEYQSRRAYIDSDVMKEKDRPTKILQAYPCFRDLDHIMEELHRILNQGKPPIIPELKNRWKTFFEKFYGVFKKMMRPPKGHTVNQTIALMKALPDMFPSPVTSPKKLEHSSEVMLHILESAEQPNTFLQSRPLLSPVVIDCETNCIVAIGTMLVPIFRKEDISDSVMYIMACYYTFHLTYSKCNTPICAADISSNGHYPCSRHDFQTYKEAIAEWKKFITE